MTNRNWFFLLVLCLEVILVSWASQSPQWVELNYSTGAYPVISRSLRAITGPIPIGVGQWLVVILFTYMVYAFVRKTRKLGKDFSLTSWFKWLGFQVLRIFTIGYGIFLLSWGFNYHRTPLQETLNLEVGETDTTQLKQVNELLIANCNTLRMDIHLQGEELPMSVAEMIEVAPRGYGELSDYPYFSYVTPSIKGVAFPKTFSWLGVAGIYSMFTGEAYVNLDPPNFSIPFTICHEMAHQVGFAPESEANFIAFLACNAHPDLNFRYSGNLRAMQYSMSALYRADSLTYKEMVKEISPEVLKDIEISRNYYRRYQGPLDDLSDWIYDYYLKANAQTEGIKSYGLMTELLLAAHNEGLIIKAVTSGPG